MKYIDRKGNITIEENEQDKRQAQVNDSFAISLIERLVTKPTQNNA